MADKEIVRKEAGGSVKVHYAEANEAGHADCYAPVTVARAHVWNGTAWVPETPAAGGGGGGVVQQGARDAGAQAWLVDGSGATQPVSAASLPLPAGAATQATLASLLTELQGKADLAETQPVSGPLTDAQLRATAVPVSGFPSSQAVTGPLTDAQLRAVAVPVSGTFFQATQPVSGTVDTELPAAIAAADNMANPTAPPILAFLLGWDGAAWDRAKMDANGHLLVGLHDENSRVQRYFYNQAIAGVTTEALMSLIPVTGFVAAAGATAHTVTAGKTFRVCAMTLTIRQTSTVLNWAEISLRVNTAGAVAVGSPIALTMRATNPAATAAAGIGTTIRQEFPRGIDIPAGAGFGITHRAAAATVELSVSLEGYEFTP